MSRNIFKYHLASWRKERIQKAYYSFCVGVPYPGLMWLPTLPCHCLANAVNNWEEGGRVKRTKGQGLPSPVHQMPAEDFFLTSCETPKAITGSPKTGASKEINYLRVLMVITDCSHSLTMQIPSVGGNVWTHLFQGKSPQELRGESPLRENSARSGLTLSMYSQESYHSLLNYCSFTALGLHQTQKAEAQPPGNHRGSETQRELQELWEAEIL